MKGIAIGLSIIGIVSGVAFALGPFVFGVRDLTVGDFLLPVVLGAFLVLAHWLTYRRFRSDATGKAGLVIVNALLLAIMLMGFLFLPPNPLEPDRPVVQMVLLAALFVAPLASNIIFLIARQRQA